MQPGVEAYLTPAGPDRLGVAFLWEKRALGPRTSFDSLLARFPVIASRLAGAAVDSAVLGAGPLQRLARSRVSDRFVLMGDAAGYLDAIADKHPEPFNFRAGLRIQTLVETTQKSSQEQRWLDTR